MGVDALVSAADRDREGRSRTSDPRCDWPDASAAALLFAVTVLYVAFLPLNLNPADESVYLYEARRLLEGRIPYRDFFEITTPGWMVLMAVLFRLFGATLVTARIAVAVMHGIAAGLLYLTGRRLGVRRGLAWPAAAAYLIVCVPAWPIASQHWLSTLLSLAVLFVCVRRSARFWPLWAGVLLGLLIGVQQQRGVILALGTFAWLAADRIVQRRCAPPAPAQSLIVRLAALIVGVLVVVLPMLAAIVAAAGFQNVWRALVIHPLLNYGGTTHCEWGDVNILTAQQASFTFPRLLAYLPVALVPSVARLGWLWMRKQSVDEARLLTVLILFCAFSVASIWYFPDFIHIAFIAPGFFLAGTENLEWLVRQVAMPVWTRRAGWVGGLLLVIGGALHLRANMIRWRTMYPFRHPTAFGTIDFASRSDVQLYETVSRLVDQVPSRELFCYPGLSHLYLLVHADNATRFQFFHTGYSSPDQVREVLDTLEAEKLPYIVVVRALATMNDAVMTYIRRNYERLSDASTATYDIYRRKGWAPVRQ